MCEPIGHTHTHAHTSLSMPTVFVTVSASASVYQTFSHVSMMIFGHSAVRPALLINSFTFQNCQFNKPHNTAILMAYFEYLLNKNEVKFEARAKNRIKCRHDRNYSLLWYILNDALKYVLYQGILEIIYLIPYI